MKISRSREKPGDDAVDMINRFNILVESGLQLKFSRQMGEGTSRQSSQEGEDGCPQPLFIPV